MPGSATVVNDDESLPGDSLLSVKDTILLGDLARPISKQGNVALALQTAVSPTKGRIRLIVVFSSVHVEAALQ